MFLKFPFEYAEIEGIGRLFYPIVKLGIKTIYGYKEFEFLVDTGADITTVPAHILPALGIYKKDLKTNWTLGVGGIKVKTHEFRLPIKFGTLEMSIKATAVEMDGNSMPLLLGRKDVLESVFSLELNSKDKVVILRKN
ncbi:MAG TPA: retropepsin-like aspartic protease [Alphaproteobacteria bacterium]|jgi:hypothetical protein|nr:retropepsin-like aspartic protease [Alphaproteobacteria bacterium]